MKHASHLELLSFAALKALMSREQGQRIFFALSLQYLAAGECLLCRIRALGITESRQILAIMTGGNKLNAKVFLAGERSDIYTRWLALFLSGTEETS